MSSSGSGSSMFMKKRMQIFNLLVILISVIGKSDVHQNLSLQKLYYSKPGGGKFVKERIGWNHIGGIPKCG
jgi:hypothetical protein